MLMRFDNEWLRKKILEEPNDVSCEVGGASMHEIEYDIAASDPRMDGIPLQKALFRISALREALKDVLVIGDLNAAQAYADNALYCDDERQKQMKD